MANVSVFEKWVKLHCQGQEVKIMVQIERFCPKEHINESHSKAMVNIKIFIK
jgi:hypothetical protein